MTDLKTLVLLTPGFAASETDANCLPMVQRLVRSINEHHPDIHVVVLAFQYPYSHGTYGWYGNPVFCFNGRNRGGLNRLLLRRKVMKVLSELHRRSSLTGLLSLWYGECALLGKQFSDRSGVRHITLLLGQDAREGNSYPSKLRLQGKEIIALSDSLADTFEKNYAVRPAYVIPPGLNACASSKERTIDILGAGSLIPLKQFDSWIRVVAALKKMHPQLKAVLAGAGPEQKKLEELSGELGMNETILFTGELPYHELMELMQSARILLHTSSYEGFSGVCQEAIAHGARVISYTQPMHSEIPGWKVVAHEAAMTRQAGEWLVSGDHGYKPFTIYPEEQQLRELLSLYDLPG